MNILHICNDYFGSKVHRNLFQSLDQSNINQTIYCPVKNSTLVRSNLIQYKFSKIIISKPMRKNHRILFRKKINFLYQDLINNIELSNINISHATNLFSDGAIAYKLFKEKGIPYIIAVRSTDIEVFLNYRPDLINIALKILNNSSKIIFISAALKDNFLKHYLIRKKTDLFSNKCIIQCNGIEDFWLDNKIPQKNIIPTEILYVGSLLKRKNVLAVANAVIALNKLNITCRFNIVGKNGDQEKQIIELSLKMPEYINYIGPIYNKQKLKTIHNNNHIFAMPSKGETFGLVYIEALSQGLPLLYSKNDGIYGVFDENIGESCNPNDEKDIIEALKKVITNYKTYEINKIDFEKFRWSNIALNYKNLYTTLKN
ncbi:glycosyltransferase family 4 protein [Maribacter sp. Hel_I_7]|uniref:glycosyltransferase family 4 protein n=1 Tax=Maribacter sp. Hel_I_7 TaxID=1249997 RepID=UPI0009E01252|nr:glycosyltransferase family 4 protein [Maribacter sp. Hel_I_7]